MNKQALISATITTFKSFMFLVRSSLFRWMLFMVICTAIFTYLLSLGGSDGRGPYRCIADKFSGHLIDGRTSKPIKDAVINMSLPRVIDGEVVTTIHSVKHNPDGSFKTDAVTCLTRSMLENTDVCLHTKDTLGKVVSSSCHTKITYDGNYLRAFDLEQL